MQNWLRASYEAEATWKRFCGSKRERILVDNILAKLLRFVKNEYKILEVGVGDGFLLYHVERLAIKNR